MNSNSQSKTPLKALSIGDVVSAGMRLYRNNFKVYFGIAVKAFLWSLIPVYGWAKYNALSALISRRAFNELLNTPEDNSTDKTYIDSRLWDFLVAQILVGLISFAAYMVFSIFGAIVVGIPAMIAVSFLTNNLVLKNTIVLIENLLRLVFMFGYLWVYSRIFIAEVPLAIEPKNEIDAVNTISRSWELTKQSVKRIQLIITSALLVSFPVYSLLFIVFIFSFIFAPFIIGGDIRQSWRLAIFGVLLIVILAIFANIILLPFWQAIKSVIYYDLRIRREGLGLQLGTRPDGIGFLNKIRLQTPESVELEFALAGIGSRAIALLIDYLALSATLLVFSIIWAIFSNQILDILEQVTGQTTGARNWFIAIYALINFFIYMGYFAFFEVLWQGQTPGKRYTKIRVIRDDGRRVSLQQVTLRSLLRPIDDTFSTYLIGAFLIMFGRREKRLGDFVAGTVVIQEEYMVASTNFAISEQAKQLANQLPEISNISLLVPDDFTAVREYLQRRGDMTPKAKAELGLQLARQVRTIILLENLPAGLTTDIFLEAVYLAYQQQ